MACAQEAAQQVLQDADKIEDPVLRQQVHSQQKYILNTLPFLLYDGYTLRGAEFSAQIFVESSCTNAIC